MAADSMSGTAGSGRTLWSIDPSLSHPEDQGVQELLHGWRGPHRVFQPGLEAAGGPGPGAGYETHGVVLLGSRASVHEDESWISALCDWLRPLLDGRQRIPLLGVCFGHQLIAHLAGGQVEFIDPVRTRIVGVQQTRLDGGRLLPGRHDLRVVVSHREQVTGVPADYRLTARRDSAPIDGLEHRELPVFTFQFHPEAREDFANSAGMDPGLIDERLRADSRRVLDAFLDRVRSNTTS
jgi:GMP synthase-like glutamine amidotransferase